MRKRLTWLLVTLGIAALVRRLRRKAEPQPDTHETADPADELRRKLADSRSEEEDMPPPEPPEDTVEERRADVHQQGRAALDEMNEPEES
jgi:hypothetical protein